MGSLIRLRRSKREWRIVKNEFCFSAVALCIFIWISYNFIQFHNEHTKISYASENLIDVHVKKVLAYLLRSKENLREYEQWKNNLCWETPNITNDCKQKKLNRTKLLCYIKNKIHWKMLRQGDEPFKMLGVDKYFPQGPIFDGQQLHSCAIVTNSGALINSSLGREIDSHDAVLRFHLSATKGHEDDVGSKTTVRFINSESMKYLQRLEPTNDKLRNITVVAHGGTTYGQTVTEWYAEPTTDLFTPYFERRARFPEEKQFYLLHLHSFWAAFDVLEQSTEAHVTRYHTSSGFLGLLFMLSHCDYVNMYEFIPSIRMNNGFCRYYKPRIEKKKRETHKCYFGLDHDLAFEKLLALSLNTLGEKDVFVKGVIHIPGVSTVRC